MTGMMKINFDPELCSQRARRVAGHLKYPIMNRSRVGAISAAGR